jgi:hypothetical protein
MQQPAMTIASGKTLTKISQTLVQEKPSQNTQLFLMNSLPINVSCCPAALRSDSQIWPLRSDLVILLCSRNQLPCPSCTLLWDITMVKWLNSVRYDYLKSGWNYRWSSIRNPSTSENPSYNSILR